MRQQEIVMYLTEKVEAIKEWGKKLLLTCFFIANIAGLLFLITYAVVVTAIVICYTMWQQSIHTIATLSMAFILYFQFCDVFGLEATCPWGWLCGKFLRRKAFAKSTVTSGNNCMQIPSRCVGYENSCMCKWVWQRM